MKNENLELSEQELNELELEIEQAIQDHLDSKLDCDFLPDTVPDEYMTDPDSLFEFVTDIRYFLLKVQAGEIDQEQLKELLLFTEQLEPVYLH